MSRFFTKTGAFYEKHKKGILLAAVIAAFIMTAAVYTFEEFYVDDFFYMKKFGTNEPIESIADIIAFQKMHYLWWGGRTPGDTILQLLLFMPRPLAGITGACGFFALVYLICKNALNGKVTLPYFCLMLGMIYHLNSNFYETVEWYTGAGFYMWPMMFVMWACVPVYTWFKTGSFTPKWYHWLLLPVILFAGWSLENVQQLIVSPETAVFIVFERYPLSKLISMMIVVLLGVFFITSADSATYSLSVMTSNGDINPPTYKKVIWGTVVAAIAYILLSAGSLKPLQTISIAATLPFLIVMLAMMPALVKDIKKDK